MYIKKIVIALSMLTSINLLATTCNIGLISNSGSIYKYMVNGEEIVVEHSNGIANLLLAHNKNTNQKYKGVVKENQICLNLSDNCVDVNSDDIAQYMTIFLEGNICQGGQK